MTYHDLRTAAILALVLGSAAVLAVFYLWWRTSRMSERVGRSVALAEEGHRRLEQGDVAGARECFVQALAVNRRLETAKEGLRACRRAERRHGVEAEGMDAATGTTRPAGDEEG